MASDWVIAKLGDVLEIKYGKDHKKLNEGDIPCFGSGGIMRHVEESLYEQESILIPRKGSLNNIYYVNQPFWTVDTLFWTKIDSDTVFPKFLFYQLKLVDFVSLNVGSAVPSLTVPVLNDLEVKLPPLSEQKAIAHILGSLDDKIELNRQMNETLEAMAQALFKSWFVDFDPVIDNALAAGNAIPDVFAERAEQRKAIEKKNHSDIQSLFPDEFEFTEEMGWIPKGWVVDDISSLCERIQSGGTPRRNIPEYWEYGTIPWLTSGEVRQTIITKVENKISESGLSNSSAKWLTSGATVVAMYGATAGQVAYINEPLTTNQAVCGLIPKKGYQFFNYVTLSRAVAHFEGRATGSAQQNINKGMIESTRVIVPSSISSDSFEEYCEVIFSKWIKNLHENETLAKLRDTLLPKLMSGELRISDTL
nr:restriction endonuclease subunit S [uncultured Psychrobacter sp.]